MPTLSISSSMNTGLLRARGLDVLDDPAGQRADVRPAVAADLRLVVDAAEAHAHELAAHRAGDALAERRLADAGRADEGEDRAADLVGEGADREVLEDALLDLLEAVVVLVEDLGGLLDVVEVVGRDVPRQADEPVDVRPDHADLGRGGRDPAHPVDFLERAGLDLVGHARGLDLLAQLVDLGLLRVLLAQLALDGLHLLAEDVLALGLVHLGLDLGLDPALELVDLDLVREEGRGDAQALGDVDRLEELLALLGGHVRRVRGHVREQAGLGDVARRDGRLGRHGRADLHVLLDLRLDRAHQRLDLDVGRGLLGQLLDPGADERVGLREAVQAHPGLALDDRADGAVLELDDLGDLGHRADGVQLRGVGDVLLVRLALGHERDAAALRDGGVQRGDALVPAHLERDDHLGEDHRLPKRDERQLGDGDGALVVRVGRSLRHRFS